MKALIKYTSIVLVLGVLIISAGLFWPATSSQSPHASAEFQHGMDLINQNRFNEAIEPLTLAFEGGYIEAGYWLGFSYRYITLPFGSPKKERFWYKKGAEAGDPYSMLALGTRKYMLCSVLDDCSLMDHYWKWKANVFLKKMAKSGDLQADWHRFNHLEAEDYNLEKEEDIISLLNKIKYFAIEGYDEAAVQFFSNYSLAKEKKSTAILILKNNAERGGIKSSWLLGHQYYSLVDDGVDLKKNSKKAIYWLKRAADKGVRQAIYNLSSMYTGQPELLNDIETLYYYCRIAYENGSTWKWCGATPREEDGQLFTIPLSNEKRKMIDQQARNWLNNNIVSRNYTYFSSFNP